MDIIPYRDRCPKKPGQIGTSSWSQAGQFFTVFHSVCRDKLDPVCCKTTKVDSIYILIGAKTWSWDHTCPHLPRALPVGRHSVLDHLSGYGKLVRRPVEQSSISKNAVWSGILGYSQHLIKREKEEEQKRSLNQHPQVQSTPDKERKRRGSKVLIAKTQFEAACSGTVNTFWIEKKKEQGRIKAYLVVFVGSSFPYFP